MTDEDKQTLRESLERTAKEAETEAAATPFDLPTLAAAVRDVLDGFAEHQIDSGCPDQLVAMVVNPCNLIRFSHLHFYLSAHGYTSRTDEGGKNTGKPLPATTNLEAKLREHGEAAREAQGIKSH